MIRAIDTAEGTTGQEIHDRTQIAFEDLIDVVNGLIDVGFLETIPPREIVPFQDLTTTVFDTNPAYGSDLRAATRR